MQLVLCYPLSLCLPAAKENPGEASVKVHHGSAALDGFGIPAAIKQQIAELLDLGTSGDQSLAGFVAGVLDEVLHEALC